MTALDTPSAYTPPSSPSDVDRWLQRHEERVAALIREALDTIVVKAYRSFAESLTAAGDLGVFDLIPGEWLDFVRTSLLDVVSNTYMGAAVGVFARIPDPPPDAVGVTWANVVNDRAVDYQSLATNRLVGVGDEMWRKVRDETTKALQAGTGNEALKDRLQDVTGFTEFRADTIGRTETVAAYNAGSLIGAQALGTYGPDRQYWIAANDRRTRETHAEADGQVVGINEAFNVGGVMMRYPGDPYGPPEETVNCRCTTGQLFPGDPEP